MQLSLNLIETFSDISHFQELFETKELQRGGGGGDISWGVGHFFGDEQVGKKNTVNFLSRKQPPLGHDNVINKISLLLD